MLALASSSMLRRFSINLSMLSAGTSESFWHRARASSAVFLRISTSIGKTAFRPNISSKGVKWVDSCCDVL